MSVLPLINLDLSAVMTQQERHGRLKDVTNKFEGVQKWLFIYLNNISDPSPLGFTKRQTIMNNTETNYFDKQINSAIFIV